MLKASVGRAVVTASGVVVVVICAVAVSTEVGVVFDIVGGFVFAERMKTRTSVTFSTGGLPPSRATTRKTYFVLATRSRMSVTTPVL